MGRGNPSLSVPHEQDGRHGHIWLKPVKYLWTDFHETWYVASGLRPIIVCSNDAHMLTLTYFAARSNLVIRLFYRKRRKQ